MTEFIIRLGSLPPKVQKNVLRTMDYGQLFGFALCSKSTKHQALSLKYAAEFVNLECTERFELHIFLQNDVKILVRFQSPHHIRLNEIDTNDFLVNQILVGEYRNESFAERDWFSNLKSVFHIKKIDNMTVVGEQMPGEFIKNAIGSMVANHLKMRSAGPEHTELLIQNLEPADTIMKLDGSFQRASKVLLQNLTVLNVMRCKTWKLDDLLMMNANFACLENLPLTSRDLNRFVKLWMKGSNPRLIHFQARAVANFDKDEVKRGIEGLDITEETRRTFDTFNLHFALGSYQVSGGFDIRRCDGTIGTLFNQNDGMFNFIVWD